MIEAVTKLLEDLQWYEEEAHPNYYDVDYEAAFSDRVRALGERELLTCLFRTLSDSRLRVELYRLQFAWRDVSFDTWMKILEDVADDRRFVYQFLFFASDTLAMEIRRLPTTHRNVRLELDSAVFRWSIPSAPSRALRARLEDDFDYESVWRRLASEGAPMQNLPSDG